MNTLEYYINFLIHKSKNDSCAKILMCMIFFDFLISSIILTLIIILVSEDVFQIDYMKNISLIDKILTLVIFAPIIETLIFQYFIIESLLLIRRKIYIPLYLIILVSGIVFGLSHNYNIYYVISTILIGVIYGFFYLIAKFNTRMNAYTSIVIVHSFANLIVVIFDIL